MLTPGIPADSFLAHMSDHRPLLTVTEKELPRKVVVPSLGEQRGALTRSAATIVSADNVNDAFKGAIPHTQDSRLCTRRIVTAHAPTRTIRAGEGITTWQVNNSEPFQIGTDALFTTHTESLPIGAMAEHLTDLHHFLCACMVELLIEAGYCQQKEEFQGGRDLYADLDIPKEELVPEGILEVAQQTLRSLLHVTRTIRRSDEQGHVTTWVLRLVEIIPYPQSYDRLAAWYYTPGGTPVETDIARHVTLDSGGGQFPECAVTPVPQPARRPKLRMTVSLLGEGTIALSLAARETLRAGFPAVHVSDTAAQYMLVSGVVTLERRRTDVREIISEAVAARRRNHSTQVLPLLQAGRAFLMFTGGKRSCPSSIYMNSPARNALRRVFSSSRASLPRSLMPSAALSARSRWRRGNGSKRSSHHLKRGSMRRNPVSLRNIPPDAMRCATGVRAWTRLSMSDAYRITLVSGCLVELTRVAPDEAGRYSGVDGLLPAKALQRLLASVIDLLLEHGQHPHLGALTGAVEPHATLHPPLVLSGNKHPAVQEVGFGRSLRDELDLLGIGFGPAEADV